MKILIFGGTTEGRVLSEKLSKLNNEDSIIVSVASDYGEEMLRGIEGVSVHVGRLDKEQMAAFFRNNRIEVVVDATHPFATEVTENIKDACSETGVRYLRLRRADDKSRDTSGIETESGIISESGAEAELKSKNESKKSGINNGPDEDSFGTSEILNRNRVIYYDTCLSAAEALAGKNEALIGESQALTGESQAPTGESQAPTGESQALTGESAVMGSEQKASADSKEGNILLTTGSKELGIFASKLDKNRLFVRVIPTESSIEKCRSEGIEESHIIALKGPFSEKTNIEHIRKYNIKYLVTKESGAGSGFSEKMSAAEKEGVEVFIIRRPGDTGMSMEEVILSLKKIKNMSR